MKINRFWLADTCALISFTFVTGMFIEVAIAGFTLQQSLISRLLCQPVNILTARGYGYYRDKVVVWLSGSRPHWLKSVLADILAYLSFQLPLYIVILLIAGTSLEGIIKASISQTLALFVLGAPYGFWLKYCRKMLAERSQQATPQPL
ncbi:L-alanine exporter AlaE [Endozoicomonas arenosclerae]|uniref:L-alanine exporter AlaE n=1 Tax=Endozoicomonas arenosclerae TaxID=1633495 RepID=UPI0007831304|nr:L-alanine exporter AlaE [Endozoicomonas arenosclerae]